MGYSYSYPTYNPMNLQVRGFRVWGLGFGAYRSASLSEVWPLQAGLRAFSVKDVVFASFSGKVLILPLGTLNPKP